MQNIQKTQNDNLKNPKKNSKTYIYMYNCCFNFFVVFVMCFVVLRMWFWGMGGKLRVIRENANHSQLVQQKNM